MSELTKKWKQYLRTRDPEMFNTIYDLSSIFVFMIAYKNTKDRSDAIDITDKVYQNLRDVPQDTENFETMLNFITSQFC